MKLRGAAASPGGTATGPELAIMVEQRGCVREVEGAYVVEVGVGCGKGRDCGRCIMCAKP